MNKLKACPCCQRMDTILLKAVRCGGDIPQWCASCGCGLELWSFDRDKVIKKWNTRSIDPRLIKAIKEIEEEGFYNNDETIRTTVICVGDVKKIVYEHFPELKEEKMIPDERLNTLKRYIYKEFLVDNVNVDYDYCQSIYYALEELQRLCKENKEWKADAERLAECLENARPYVPDDSYEEHIIDKHEELMNK